MSQPFHDPTLRKLLTTDRLNFEKRQNRFKELTLGCSNCTQCSIEQQDKARAGVSSKLEEERVITSAAAT